MQNYCIARWHSQTKLAKPASYAAMIIPRATILLLFSSLQLKCHAVYGIPWPISKCYVSLWGKRECLWVRWTWNLEILNIIEVLWRWGSRGIIIYLASLHGLQGWTNSLQIAAYLHRILVPCQCRNFDSAVKMPARKSALRRFMHSMAGLIPRCALLPHDLVSLQSLCHRFLEWAAFYTRCGIPGSNTVGSSSATLGAAA
jgi:hypothetical protein